MFSLNTVKEFSECNTRRIGRHRFRFQNYLAELHDDFNDAMREAIKV